MVTTDLLATFSVNQNRVLDSDPIGTINIRSSSQGVATVNCVASWWVLGPDNVPTTSYVYTNDPLLVWVVSDSGRSIIRPKSISLLDLNGNKVTSIQMTGGETREFYVEVDDYFNDGNIENDFDDLGPPRDDTNLEYATNINNMTGSNVIAVVDMVPRGIYHSAGDNYPRRISTITITALNPGGDEQSNYNDRYASFYWGMTFSPGPQNINTQSLNIMVTARDNAGGSYDDGGGTCNAVGLGALALLLPVMFLRKRR
jgi:Synergist-CTERM protein sorting domain-containing protein